MFIAVCSCGLGVCGDDRSELGSKVAAHLKGEFFPAAQVPGQHAAWIGEASARIILSVQTVPVEPGEEGA